MTARDSVDGEHTRAYMSLLNRRCSVTTSRADTLVEGAARDHNDGTRLCEVDHDINSPASRFLWT